MDAVKAFLRWLGVKPPQRCKFIEPYAFPSSTRRGDFYTLKLSNSGVVDLKQYSKWKDCEISGNNLVLFPASGEIDVVSYPGFKVFTFSLHVGSIQKMQSQ